MDSSILESVFREELRLAGERWQKKYKEMSDKERLRLLGCFAARRLISEAVDRKCKMNDTADEDPYMLDPELEETRGPLGSGTGGGRRIVRGTKSMS